MPPTFCAQCGMPYRPGDRYCGHCGTRRSADDDVVPVGPRYFGLWFQVDPLSPAPRRDVRYVMIVTGIALTIVGLLLAAVSGIITSALSLGGASCASGSCTAVDPGAWFLWFAAPLLVAGLALLGVGLWWALFRRPHPT